MVCEECSLPMAVCNALASYRQAVKNFRRGRFDEADESVESAEDEYKRYLDGRSDVVEEGEREAV